MNTSDSDKQRLLDLLVDGELSEAQRREVLAWCQSEPDGWRRCALAFLDAQSWSNVLGQMAAGRAVTGRVANERMVVQRGAAGKPSSDDPLWAAPAAGASVVERQRAAQPHSWFGSALALAASALVAFTVGLWARGGFSGGAWSDNRPLMASGEHQALSTVAERDGAGSGALSADRPEQGPRGKVRLVVGGSAGAADEIQLPVVEGQSLGDDWLHGQPAMPLDVQQALERLGHRVRQQRQLVPFPLEDGRRVMVPVDQIDVQPVADRAFQ